MIFSWTVLLLAFSSLLGFLSMAILLVNRIRFRIFIEPLILNLLVTTLWIFHRLLMETQLILEVPHLYRTTTPLVVLAGPTVFLYVRAILHGEVNWRKRDWLHLIPGVLVALCLLPFYSRSAAYKRAWLENLYQEPSRFAEFPESVLPPYAQHMFDAVVVLGYAVLTLVMIFKYLKKTAGHPHNVRPGAMAWMIFHTVVALSLGIAGLSVFLLESIPQVFFFSILNSLIGLLCFPLFLLLFFNPAILYGIQESELREIKRKSPGDDSALPYGLEATKKKEIQDTLQAYMEQSKPYLSKDLSLPQLAQHLGVTRHQLSYIINSAYQSNFNAFINDLRIGYCLNHFTPAQWNAYTLDGIADAIGFGSRGTFIRAFKKKTGMLPSEYRTQVIGKMRTK
jgi:AraC-like DNA-binding protein